MADAHQEPEHPEPLDAPQAEPGDDGEAPEQAPEPPSRSGPLAWMAQNPVAANLLMLVLIVGGLLMMLTQVQREVFPEITLDVVTITVPYPGANPAEVEQGTILAVEEAVRGLDGIKEVRSTAREGQGLVTAELMSDADRIQTYNDIKSGVERITSFPEDAETPIVSLATNRRQVISLILHGDTTRKKLKSEAERVRRELLEDELITTVELAGVPPPEISVEVPRQKLRSYRLTLPQIARAIDEASVELPAGGAETPGGEVLVRTAERRKTAAEFEQVVVRSGRGGGRVELGEIAEVEDEWRDTERAAYFDGDPAVRVDVYRVGDQTPLGIAEAVKSYAQERREQAHPGGIAYDIWADQSEVYESRINLLLENALLGLALVLVILGFFLEGRLAFWVTLGIPITFLGAFFFMVAFGVSINMLSLFAFLLALGIVVDDAIVVGEAIYSQRSAGLGPLDAAIAGAREVGAPVIFAVLTTVLAFVPLLFVPGVTGEFFSNIPLVVIPILILSLIESLLILPAHLAHGGERSDSGVMGRIRALQQSFSEWVEGLIDTYYEPVARAVVRWRQITLSASIAVLLVFVGLIGGGVIDFVFFPKIESDQSNVTVVMPYGTPRERTRQVTRRLERAARQVMDEAGGVDALSEGIYVDVGTTGAGGGPGGGGAQDAGGHVARMTVQLTPPGSRQLSARAFTDRWREAAGAIPGADSVKFSFSIGPDEGAPVSVQLSHPDTQVLRRAAEDVARKLGIYEGVYDIDDGFKLGKEELELELTDRARSLGLVERQLAAQVRGAFFGVEALREQRGRDELRVYVRLPEDQRDSVHDILQLEVFTPEGGALKLDRAADISYGRSYTTIEREGGRRVIDVTADVDTSVTTGGEVSRDLREEVLPKVLDDYEGVSYEFGGEREAQREALRALGLNSLVALLAIYALMAVAFRSYAQPLLIMFAIPFGFVGAVIGHLLLGYQLSIISMLGIVALTGVVVNDSLVLIDAVNTYRDEEGMEPFEAVIAGSKRRFRPILLTSLTTFFGLAPMILETSVQAQFLIPMALSLGFGVLFVTVIALVIVPAAYMALEDVRGWLGPGEG